MNKNERFERIYNEFFKRVYKYVYFKIPRLQDVEDITAEVFSVVWKNIDILDEQNNIKGFIFRIASNKINDFLRVHYKVTVKESTLEWEDTFLNDEKDTENKNEPLLKIISKLVVNLSDRDNKVFTLKYKQKLSNNEIAAELNITKNNVKVIHNRLVKKLKNLWEAQK